MSTILALHGPNLNLLGTREPETYGSTTLAHINEQLEQLAATRQVELDSFQSNAEAALVERIHAAASDDPNNGGIDFIIFNPAALTHSSIALRDALLAVQIPFIEVHLSNVHSRESFRHQSYLSDIAVGVISGLGVNSYKLALTAAIDHLQT